MMITPLRIGIAVACLIGVAILIAVDLGNGRKESPAPAVAPATPPPPVAPAAPVVSAAPERPVLCPEPAPKESEPAVRPEGEEKTADAAKPSGPASASEKKSTPEAADGSSPEPRNYTVVAGDSLYGISVKLYGTPKYYERIYELNRDRIRDANTLQIGINLKLPDAPKPVSGPISNP
jgi:nucleoid-associated protein YgaU